MNNAPDKITDPATNPAPVRELVPGSTGNAENPYPWFRPMPVVWVCVIICIVLIVVGSMMNRAQAEARKRPAMDSFSKLLNDFDFTPQQREILVRKYEDVLDGGGTDSVKHKRVERVIVQIARSLTCVALDAMKEMYQKAFDNELVSTSLHSGCTHQCNRLIYAVSRGLISDEIVVGLMGTQLENWKELNDDKMKQFIDECRRLADDASVPETVEKFDLYESVLRGFSEH